ncbi:MAG: hypothetical protein CL828_02245, partial [Crocinitomicaceae bacterium]|nr:hypothetical protein [Crocinitomicaceae bacterium]
MRTFALTIGRLSMLALLLISWFHVSADSGIDQSGALSLKGVMDFTVPSGGSNGKAIHVVANEDISDLSAFGLGVANNGDGSEGMEYTFPAMAVSAGDDILVARSSSDIEVYFGACYGGFEHVFQEGFVNQNGNDAIELFESNTVIETFGDVNVDGTGEDWEYLDSWAYHDGTSWTYGNINCTDGTTTIFDSDCLYPMCSAASSNDDDCYSDLVFDQSRGDCVDLLPFESVFTMEIDGPHRTISSNSIPDHMVGLFGQGPGSLNPHLITEHDENYAIPVNPNLSQALTPLLSTSGPDSGPIYSFGIMLNGVELDPVASEPFPHNGNINDENTNWEWNKEALNVNLGLDCNGGHVNENGEYHYHAIPTDYFENSPTDQMSLVGFAADGFPIYHKYAYEDPFDSSSPIIEMVSSYKLKTGMRPGDGITAPCDEYNGVYSNDYEYESGLGTLDEANGREGITPDFPEGTYYYILTDHFPGIPRYFKGTPSIDFKLGVNGTDDLCDEVLYEFNIEDSYGDGIVCEEGGGYTILSDGDVLFT